MHIFIDESGAFQVPSPPVPKVSCVVALCVPSSSLDELFKRFSRLKREISSEESELKGSKLTDKQVARVFTLLRAFDPVLSIAAIDMGSHNVEHLAAFQRKQCAEITSSLTAIAHDSVHKELGRQRALCESLSSQLFVQCFLTVVLIKRALEEAVNYYAQRQPDELGSFCWRIDAKNPGQMVGAEHFWTSFILPALTSGTSTNRPFFKLFEGADYSAFEHFSTEHPMNPSLSRPLDLAKLLGEDRTFVDSRDCLGVQLADIVSNATYRAFNGHLEFDGWRDLGRLLIHRDVQTVQLVQLNAHKEPGETVIKIQSPFVDVVRRIEACAKPMLTPEYQRLLNKQLLEKKGS